MNQGKALEVQDLSELSSQYLTPSAKIDMSNKALNQVVRTEDGQVFVSLYLSVTVIEGLEEDGVKEIAKILNDLSQRGEIHSALSPISSVRLAMMNSVPKSAVFAFPLVPATKVKEISERYAPFVTKEGEVGPPLHYMHVPLAKGEFLTSITVSPFVLKTDKTVSDLLQEELNQYLKVLPKGTQVRKITPLAIVSLAKTFEVKFYNPLLEKVKRVELGYVRETALLNPNKIEMFNLLVGVNYFDENDENLYS